MICHLCHQPLEGDQEESVDIQPIALLEGNQKVKEGKRWTSNKLLTRLPLMLEQIKAGTNSHKLKNEIRQIMSLLY